MATSRIRAFLLIAVPLLILMLPLSIYVIDSAAASDKVARNVSIAGVDVSRYSRSEAVQAVDRYAADLTAHMAVVSVNGQTFELDPAEVGLAFDSEGAVDTAFEQNNDGLTDWLRAFSEQVDVPVDGWIDEAMLDAKIREWEQEAIPNPAFDGAIEIVDGAVLVDLPEDGEAIDRDVALEKVTAALIAGSDEVITLPTSVSQPSLTEQDFEEATAEAERMMSTSVTLTDDAYGFSLFIDSYHVARALEAHVTEASPPSIEFTFDHTKFRPLIEGARPQLELAPQDASWETILVDDHESWDENYEIRDSPQEGRTDLPEDDVITLVPSKNGTTIDAAAVAQAVEDAVRGDGEGTLPIVPDAQPEFTTEMAEAYGDLYEVSEFTTYMPGTNRAHNIKLMADLIDGTIVWPGETFSVNEHVGRRTLEKGFRYDCAIVGGELSCEEDPVNVGGGVSQFGTTIFNAIYFGCYKDVFHQPHSIYFSKYPEGREATLGYPLPDVAFENDSKAPVIIRTSYTNRSITVTFFGNQEGRFCGTERSERTNVTSPVREYRADPDGIVRPGQEVVKSGGSKGWSVTNTRIFYDADGNEISREPFVWRYRGEKNVILMHPCEPRVGGNGACPTQVPSVVGLGESAATTALGQAGFAVVVTTEATSNPGQDGVVMSSSPRGWQAPGTTVTIVVGVYDGSGGDGGGSDGGGSDGGGSDGGGSDGGGSDGDSDT